MFPIPNLRNRRLRRYALPHAGKLFRCSARTDFLRVCILRRLAAMARAAPRRHLARDRACWSRGPPAGPKLLWKSQGLGEGYSAFSVVGNRLFTQGQEGSQEFVMAFDTNTGKQLWKTASGRAYNERAATGRAERPLWTEPVFTRWPPTVHSSAWTLPPASASGA